MALAEVDSLFHEVNLLKSVSPEVKTSGISKQLEQIKQDLYEVRHTDTGPLPKPLVLLRKEFESSFSVSELEGFVFDNWGMDLENVKGETKKDLIVNLIAYFQRRGLLTILIEAAMKARPEKKFSELLAQFNKGDDSEN